MTKSALAVLFLLLGVAPVRADSPLLIATFKLDVTPPIGTPLCDALCQPASAVDDPLSARGLVLLPVDQKPIVLIALDWVGVGNEGQDVFRQAVADAAGT